MATTMIDNTTIPGYGNVTTTSNESTTTISTVTPFRGKVGFGELERYDEFWVAYYINTIYLWPILVIGLFGNIGALVTIRCMGRLSSPLIYMLALAASDICALVIKIMYHQFTREDVEMGPWGCRFLRYLGTYFTETSNWILVMMTLERTLAVWFPLNATQYFSKRNAVIVLLVVFSVLSLANLFSFWYITDTYSTTVKLDCGVMPEYKDFVAKYWYWIDGAIYTLLPCLIIIPCNLFIVCGLRRSKDDMISGSANQTNSNKLEEQKKQQRQMTVMLVSVSIMFMVLTLPNAIFFAVESQINFKTSYQSYARYLVITQCIHLLSDSNHALNFFMYFLAGTKFRHAFLQLLPCSKAHKLKYRQSGATVSYTVSSKSASIST